jgi:hypothetical protein
VEQAGHNPVLFSKKQKSVIPGSQHLHGPVPDLTSPYPEGTIQFVRIGSAENYALKVYGDPERETGWDNYLQVYPSWNVLKAYDRLWDRFGGRVNDVNITPQVVRNLQDEYSCIISTIPQGQICEHKHDFKGVRYWIQQLPTPPADVNHEIVVYNGMLTDPWYRWSILGGLCSIEYMKRPADVSGLLHGGYKAVDNDCDCFRTVHRCGRWAEWRHGVTMFKAYEKAVQIMEAL